jgi:ubiquinone biosynthesis protein COQ4
MEAMAAAPTIDTRLRPFEALRAVGRLFDNPEDTSQVFTILAALRGRSGHRMFTRFRKTRVGAAVLAEKRQLLDRLQDRAGLLRLPQGSLGRAYQTFMGEENLSPDGLVDASMSEDYSALPPEAKLFRERMRDMHDLTHVLTGYGRDGMGELCLLTFMYAHTRNPGMALIALMGLLRFGRGRFGRPMRAALLEAWRNGRRAQWLPAQDWEAMLERPLADLRGALTVGDPVHYRTASAIAAGQAPPVVQRRAPFGRLKGALPLIRSLAINTLGPFAAYAILERSFPSLSIVPLLGAAAIPAIDMGVVFARRRLLDAVAAISLTQLTLSLIITVLSNSPRAAMFGHALQPAGMGLVFAVSTLIGRPLIVPLARQSMAGDDPQQAARFDAMITHPAARRRFALVSGAWTLGLCLQSAVQLALLQELSVKDYILAANVVSYAVYGVLIWGSISYGRWSGRQYRERVLGESVSAA